MSNTQTAGILITMPSGEPTPALPYMAEPEWLFTPGTLSEKLFDTKETAQEIYRRFFAVSNKATQQNLFQQLSHGFRRAQEQYPEGDSLESKAKNRDAWLSVFVQWFDQVRGFFDILGVEDIYFCVNVSKDKPNRYICGEGIQTLSQGGYDMDFLALGSKETQIKVFDAFCLNIAVNGLPKEEPQSV